MANLRCNCAVRIAFEVCKNCIVHCFVFVLKKQCCCLFISDAQFVFFTFNRYTSVGVFTVLIRYTL